MSFMSHEDRREFLEYVCTSLTLLVVQSYVLFGHFHVVDVYRIDLLN